MKTRFLLSVGVGLMLCAPAFAQMGGGDQPGMMMHRDQKGDISKEQFLADHDAMFARGDRDKDGVITKAEREANQADMSKKMEEMRAKRMAMMEKKHAEMLKKTDADGDGNVSKAEHDAAAAARFATLDKNGDGKLSADEKPGKRHHGWRDDDKEEGDDD